MCASAFMALPGSIFLFSTAVNLYFVMMREKYRAVWRMKNGKEQHYFRFLQCTSSGVARKIEE